MLNGPLSVCPFCVQIFQHIIYVLYLLLNGKTFHVQVSRGQAMVNTPVDGSKSTVNVSPLARDRLEP